MAQEILRQVLTAGLPVLVLLVVGVGFIFAKALRII